jgi:RNA polymerase sigma-70 factor (ECF subfamily)
MTMATAPDTTGFDPAALIETYQQGVWRYLRVLGCQPAQADDLTQETFLAVLQRPFVHHGSASTVAYLRKVAFHQFVSAQRRAGKVVAVENFEDLDRSWEEWSRDDNGEELLEALRDCLLQLTKRARMALELRFHGREARTDIAVALGITEHGAKNLMQRAKKQLRKCIEGKVRERDA